MRILMYGFVGLVLLWSSCTKEYEATEDFPYTKDDIFVERSRDVDILQSDSAILKVRIQGPLMLNYSLRNDPHQEFPEGIRVDFFDKYGELSSTLTAKFAVRYESKSNVIVRDSVVWKSVQNDQLETSELIWDERTNEIYTNKFVVITRPQDTIYSQGLRANSNFTKIQLRATDGTIIVEEYDPGGQEE